MITEDQLEQLAIQWFQDTGWNYVAGPDLAPEGASPERADFRAVVLKARLASAVKRLNPKLPPAVIEEVVHVVTTPGETSLARNNLAFHRLLMNGVKVEFTNAKGEKETDHAQLIDFRNPAKNDFLVVNQFTVAGTKKPRRPDLVAFVSLGSFLAFQCDREWCVRRLRHRIQVPTLSVYSARCLSVPQCRVESFTTIRMFHT